MTPPLIALLIVAAITAGAAAYGQVAVARRRRRFEAQAAKLNLRHAPGDPLNLAARLAPHLPTPGVAAVRVLETLYEPGGATRRGLALVEYETHPLTGGRRRRTLVRFDGDAVAEE